MFAKTVAGAAALAAVLVTPTGASAVACVNHDLGTGRVAGVVQPSGTPDTDWVIAATPLLGAPAPAVVVDRNANWSPLPGAGWVSLPGGSGAGLPVDVSGLMPVGVYTYEARFVVPPLGYAPFLNLTYLSDNGVQFFLNGAPLGGYLPPSPGDNSSFTTARAISVAPPYITGVNVLQARVTNYAGPVGLAVSGAVTVCV